VGTTIRGVRSKSNREGEEEEQVVEERVRKRSERGMGREADGDGERREDDKGEKRREVRIMGDTVTKVLSCIRARKKSEVM
jgi:hypothetical protein